MKTIISVAVVTAVIALAVGIFHRDLVVADNKPTPKNAGPMQAPVTDTQYSAKDDSKRTPGSTIPATAPVDDNTRVAKSTIQATAPVDDNKPTPKSPDDSSVTLVGKITCARCELNDSLTCYTVLLVRDPDVGPNENDRNIVYYFDAASSKKYHNDVCNQGVNGTVVGTVTEKDGIKAIAVAKLSFKSQGPPK